MAWPTSVAEPGFLIRFVQIGPWRTRVLEAGTGEETVILMPGTGGHLETYARNIPAIARHYRVLAYDYPGHGYTTPATSDLEVPHYTDHLNGLLDTYRLDHAHLTGNSLGAWIAIKYAAAHPERTAKLILTTLTGTTPHPDETERLRALSQAAADDPTPERIRARLQQLIADPAHITDHLIQTHRAIYAQPGFAESMRHILCLHDPAIRRRNLITDEELTALPGPTLLL